MLKDLSLTVSPGIETLIKQDMEALYSESGKDSNEQRSIINRNLTELTNKMARLHEKFIDGDIERETYWQMKGKFEGEREKIELHLSKMGKELSNLQKCLDLAMEFSSNLPSLWDLSDYANKQRIQYLIFPEGIYVDKENRDYRTPKVNSVCLYLARLKRVLAEKESGKTNTKVNFPASVVWGEKLTGSTAAKIIFVYGKTLNFDVLGNPGIFLFFLLTVSDATKNFDSAIVDCMSFQIPLICIMGLLKALSALLLRR